MSRILTVAIAAALFVAPALRADDSKTGEVKSKRSEEVKEFAAFPKKMQDFAAKFAKATPDERKEMASERPNPAALVEKANKLIEEDAKDEAALEALVFLAQYGGQKFGAKELELLGEHHAASAKVGKVCMRAMQVRGPEGEKFLTVVLEKNKNKEPLGLANYAMGQLKMRSGGEAAAIPYFEKIEKFYGDVEIGRTRDGKPVTLARTVGGTLFALRNLATGKTVPDVVSKDLEDKKVELKDLRGKVVVLDFWATWCPPCRAMIPHSNELVKKMKDKPFVLVSVSSDEKKDTLTEFLKKNEMPWTHWWEPVSDSNLHSKWGVSGIPTCYVIDAKGVIRHKAVGFSAAAKEQNEKFDQLIEDLVKEAEEKK